MPDDCADNLLKGIPNESFISGKSVKFTLFIPPGKTVDGWKESSINWEDDGGALVELLERKRNGTPRFKGGAVRIPREKVDGIIVQHNVQDTFTYQRKQDTEKKNKYHGNLLFAENMHNEIRDTICGILAGAVIHLERQKGE